MGMHPEQRSLYVVATSGDTGSAVLEGFGRLQQYKSQLALLVMYPENGISTIQKQQMVSFDGGKNVTVVGIRGNFDDCQKNRQRALCKRILSSRNQKSF